VPTLITLTMDQFLGVLEVELPPILKPISEPSVSLALTDVSADDFFVAAASHFAGVTAHSSYLKKVGEIPFSWRADVSSKTAFVCRKEVVKVAIVSKGAVVELPFVLKPATDMPPKASKKIDGIAVNFSGIPPMLKDSEAILKFLNFSLDSVFKCMPNTYTRKNLDGVEFVLSRGTARIIFFKSKLPDRLRNVSGRLEFNFMGSPVSVKFSRDSKKKREGDELQNDLDKRRKLLGLATKDGNVER
jgi:hypothetical protein